MKFLNLPRVIQIRLEALAMVKAYLYPHALGHRGKTAITSRMGWRRTGFYDC